MLGPFALIVIVAQCCAFKDKPLLKGRLHDMTLVLGNMGSFIWLKSIAIHQDVSCAVGEFTILFKRIAPATRHDHFRVFDTCFLQESSKCHAERTIAFVSRALYD